MFTISKNLDYSSPAGFEPALPKKTDVDIVIQVCRLNHSATVTPIYSFDLSCYIFIRYTYGISHPLVEVGMDWAKNINISWPGIMKYTGVISYEMMNWYD